MMNVNHKQPVIDEKEELDRRTNVLHAFFDTPIFESLPTAEKLRLDKQWKLMVQLSDVLDERIQYLNEEPNEAQSAFHGSRKMSNVTLISDSDIDKLYSRASVQEKSIFDCKADFFSLMYGSLIMCSVPIKVVGMRRGYTEDGPFFIDFAVETPTKGVHTLHSNVRVLYLSLESRDGMPADSVGFCRPEDVDALLRISNEMQP